MKKEKKLTTEEAFVEVFKTMLDFSIEEDKLYMKHLHTKIDFLNKQIALVRESEPLKIFKSSHQKWNTELEDLENQLIETYKQVENEIKEQQNFFDKLKETK